VKLQRGIEWVISERLEGGGFGQVHAAKSAEYESAVAKLVPKVPGAEREVESWSCREPKSRCASSCGRSAVLWMCLADFGISRYAEATTAPDTRKYRHTGDQASDLLLLL
jgi:hypothetical protein